MAALARSPVRTIPGALACTAAQYTQFAFHACAFASPVQKSLINFGKSVRRMIR